MTTAVAEAAAPPRLTFKVAATDVEAPGTVEVREDEGIVEAIVSVTGIEDEVKDIIEPGAYADTLTKRRPKVIWHHSWEHPIGRILHIEELHPGDSRLPEQTKDGKPWPKAAGGLLATMQFNLKSDRGREAFEAVRFYSETGECEWSIGYQVPETAQTMKKGIRHLKAIDLYEISFVLFGAASQTGTLGLKAAVAAAELRLERKTATGTDPGASAVLGEVVKTLPLEYKEAGDGGAGGTTGDAAPAPGGDGGAPAESAPPPGPETAPEPTETPEGTPDPEPGQEPAEPATEPPAEADQDPDDSDDDGDGDEHPDADTEAALDAEVQATLDQMTEDDWADVYIGVAADDLDYAAALMTQTITTELATQQKAITPGGRVGDDSPVGEPGGTPNWVDKVGGLPRYIRMVAHALIRKGMSESRAIATAVNTIKKWAAGAKNVSAKVQAAAAAALAEWEAKKAASHAEKARLVQPPTGPGPAVPDWARRATKARRWTPTLERGQYAATKEVVPTSYHDFPKVEGTFEERLDQVRNAVVAALKDTYEADEYDTATTDQDDTTDESAGCWSHIEIVGTWPDRVIATCHKWGGSGVDRTESYEMNYTIADDGEVTLSEPEPMKLSVYAEPVDGDQATDPEMPVGDLIPVPDMVEDATKAAQALLLAHRQAVETKAGRVLSGINEARLKGALESLIAVLRAAGIDIDTGEPKRVVPPQPDTGTTAPAGREGKVLLDPAQVQADLTRLLGD